MKIFFKKLSKFTRKHLCRNLIFNEVVGLKLVQVYLAMLLIENDRIVSENHKKGKTFNKYFETVTDSLNIFEWIGESVNSNDKTDQIITKFSKLQVY